jgi:hypothetical protein
MLAGRDARPTALRCVLLDAPGSRIPATQALRCYLRINRLQTPSVKATPNNANSATLWRWQTSAIRSSGSYGVISLLYSDLRGLLPDL